MEARFVQMIMEKGKNAEKHYQSALELDAQDKHQTELNEYCLAAELGHATAKVISGRKTSHSELALPDGKIAYVMVLE